MTGKKSEETLQIRLYAVDCPEVAHFGNPAQPWSAEAKEVQWAEVKIHEVGVENSRIFPRSLLK